MAVQRWSRRELLGHFGSVLAVFPIMVCRCPRQPTRSIHAAEIAASVLLAFAMGCGGGDASASADASGPTIDARWPDGDAPCSGSGIPMTPAEESIAQLPADTWWAAPSSTMREVCARPRCQNAIDAWSGAVYDSTHNQLLLWGGGHADYSGNEVYAFDLATLTWSRLTEPSLVEYESVDPLPDGQPVSRHTYGGLAWNSDAKRLVGIGGARWKDGGGTGVTWAFDPVAKVWENRGPDSSPAGRPSHGSIYDPVNKRMLLHDTTSLYAYDYDANTWSKLTDFGFPPYWPRYQIWGDKTLVESGDRQLLFGFGSGLYFVYDMTRDEYLTDSWITTGGATFENSETVGGRTEQLITTGGGEVITASAPGVAYDTAADMLVSWPNKGPVWRLSLATKTWSSGADPGDLATNRPSGGTFGRWRYLPRVNAFILVNSVDENVLFYKNTAACGP